MHSFVSTAGTWLVISTAHWGIPCTRYLPVKCGDVTAVLGLAAVRLVVQDVGEDPWRLQRPQPSGGVSRAVPAEKRDKTGSPTAWKSITQHNLHNKATDCLVEAHCYVMDKQQRLLSRKRSRSLSQCKAF